MLDSTIPTIAFVDDQPDFLDVIRGQAEGRGLSVRTTSDPDEGLKWAESGEIDELVADLRMNESGLSVLKKAQRISDVRTSILTTFLPTDEEERQANDLGVRIYKKQYLDAFFDRLEEEFAAEAQTAKVAPSSEVENDASANASILLPGRGSQSALKGAQELLVEWLRGRRDKDSQTIYYDGKSYSVSQLIREIEFQTPVGQAHLSLY